MRLYFTKMQGLGNDYIYLDGFDKRMQRLTELSQQEKAELAVRMSRRHTGIGADGLIFVLPSERADCRMEMYNADGSRGAMCGNGIRCVALYAMVRGIAPGPDMEIETDSGVRQVRIRGEKDRVTGLGRAVVRVDMGGITNLGERRLEERKFGKKMLPVQLAAAGNRHCIIFTEQVADFPLKELAEGIQAMPDFEGFNVEAAAVVADTVTGRMHIDMRVYEWGSGETMACGTGACAVCAAAVWQGYCRYDEDVEVRQPGGRLITAYLADGRMMMEGEAAFVFEGIWDEVRREDV